MERDLLLVRSAILYADTVQLVSPGAAMLANVATLANGDERNLLGLLTSLDDGTIAHLGASELPENWREVLSRMAAFGDEEWDLVESLAGQPVPQEARSASKEFRERLRQAASEMQQVAAGMIQDSGANELTAAFDAGLLTLSPSGLDKGADAESFTAGYVDILRGLLRNTSAHLLFDEQIRDLVRSLINEGQVEPSTLTMVQAGRAAIGSGLVARLPAFPGVPLDELIDLRSDLDDPLSRYRRSVAQMSAQMNVSAVNPELEAEIDDLWTVEVDPTLRDLREGLAEHGLVRDVARSLAEDVSSVVAGATGSTITLGFTSLSHLSGWLQVAGGALPLASALAGSAIKGIHARGDGQHEVQRHDLFYLVELGRRLQRNGA
ncbi:hypothetical protein ASD06_17600 [Angustibacter sp. Root456]|nr:hypothetical protein ASD06_17600 [Angustibacter sp. Root456]